MQILHDTHNEPRSIPSRAGNPASTMSSEPAQQNPAQLGILTHALCVRLKGFTMQSTLPLSSGISFDPAQLRRSLAGRVALTVAASGFVALCAHVSVPLYFTPVPLTLQTLAVILVGLTLGPALGFSAMALYLAEGAMGMPVFSPHGLGGVAQLLGPTGGYLFSYPLAAAVAGWMVRTVRIGNSRFAAALLAGSVASIFVFAMGAGWLAHFKHLGFGPVWLTAIVPFLLGEVVKVSAAAGIYSSLSRWYRS